MSDSNRPNERNRPPSEAQARFFREYGPKLDWALRRLLAADMASQEQDDLVQEVLLRALRDCDIESMTPEHAMAWILRTAKNLIVDRHRSRSAEEVTGAVGEDGEFVLVGRAATTPGRRAEEAEEVDAALRQLSDTDREILVFRSLEQPYEDLAAELGIEIGAVRMRYSRSLARLAKWRDRRSRGK